MDLKEIYSKKSKFATRKVGNELILVPIRSTVTDMNEMFTLNEVGSFIWDLIDEKHTEDDIVKAVADAFTVDESRAGKDVSDFLVRLENILLKLGN